MKLLPLLLLICLDCGAQKKDTTSTFWQSNPDSGYGLLLSSGWLGTVDSTVRMVKPKYDTVRMVMLVCDTQWSTQTYSYSNTKYDIDFTIDLSKIVRWQFGYEIRERVYSDFSFSSAFRHVSYLDDRSRPISKSIIVWQSIKL